MNAERFLAGQRRYFENAYQEFRLFGGPSVYFHERCLEAAADEFLSLRHVEMLYATLASWGMHRTGNPDATKTKLTDWDQFHVSIIEQRAKLDPFAAAQQGVPLGSISRFSLGSISAGFIRKPKY